MFVMERYATRRLFLRAHASTSSIVQARAFHDADPLGEKIRFRQDLYSGTPLDSYAPPPMFGQHTDEVPETLLGVGAERREEMRAAGVI